MSRNSSVRDKILRYLHLGLSTEELLSCFTPYPGLVDLVYSGGLNLKREAEQPLFAPDGMRWIGCQDLVLTMIPKDSGQVRQDCLKFASETTQRQISDEHILLFKSLIVIETDPHASLHAVIRSLRSMEFAIRRIYHKHPRYWLETLRLFVVLPQEPAPDLTAFALSCGIQPVVVDAGGIPAQFAPEPPKVPVIPRVGKN